MLRAPGEWGRRRGLGLRLDWGDIVGPGLVRVGEAGVIETTYSSRGQLGAEPIDLARKVLALPANDGNRHKKTVKSCLHSKHQCGLNSYHFTWVQTGSIRSIGFNSLISVQSVRTTI